MNTTCTGGCTNCRRRLRLAAVCVDLLQLELENIGSAYNYTGCFKNENGLDTSDSPHLDGHLRDKTVAQCNDAAHEAGALYFGMQ